ncbi:unnamed protein product [Peronospora farinosa]|uniref:Reverse transcriptase Ty1/copia-type domain-containing protein n=1 Tax=Peronospora farinosa TaxID=134698 RepID=A0AAV0TVA1_9STRA|nr:unnamed protein product [Peronospora farinosa]
MVLRQSTERRYPSWLEEYLVNAALHENSESLTANHRWRANETKIPKSFTEAMKTPQKDEWYHGMENEVNAMFSKRVLVPIDEAEDPAKANKLGLMWRFQVKTDDQEFITRFRPRLVGLGNHQQPGIDYVESFSPVARIVTFRVLVALATKFGLVLYQGDVQTAYLNANLQIRQYVRNIPGFPQPPGIIYRVDRALYGLHQSGAEWNEEIDNWLVTQEFKRSETEPCLYFYCKHAVLALLMLYVDDVVLATDYKAYKASFFEAIDAKYGFQDGGKLHYFLGINVEQDETDTYIHQTKYCKEVLEKVGFGEAHELNKYGRPVGWHGQSWAYYKGMMKLTFEEKDVLDYATGNKILVGNASANEVKAFREAQVTIKQLILASLSMELGLRVMTKATGTEMWKYLEDFYEGKTNAATRTNQEIILYNKLNAMKCKPTWDVAQHVESVNFPQIRSSK